MRALGFHVDEAGGLAQGALRAEDQAVAVVGAARGHHVGPLRAADLVAGEVGGREELEAGGDYGLVGRCDGVGGWVREQVGGHEEGVGARVEDARVVEVGRARVVDEDRERRGGADEREEGVVVDEEGARLGFDGEGDRFSGGGGGGVSLVCKGFLVYLGK